MKWLVIMNWMGIDRQGVSWLILSFILFCKSWEQYECKWGSIVACNCKEGMIIICTKMDHLHQNGPFAYKEFDMFYKVVFSISMIL